MIRILTTSFNGENWIKNCIDSLKAQTLEDWRCYITDDFSTDNSVSKIKDLIEGDDRFTLVENTKKLYQVGNYENLIRSGDFGFDDEDICIEVDGDDWLAHKTVLADTKKVYETTKCWMTYGYPMYTTRQRHPSCYPGAKNLRSTAAFSLSHLRSWKAFLWRGIKHEDLLVDGNYPLAGGDSYFMIPMAEMSGDDRVAFIDDVNYIYNFHNPLNDCKMDVKLQHGLADLARLRTPYQLLNP